MSLFFDTIPLWKIPDHQLRMSDDLLYTKFPIESRPSSSWAGTDAAPDEDLTAARATPDDATTSLTVWKTLYRMNGQLEEPLTEAEKALRSGYNAWLTYNRKKAQDEASKSKKESRDCENLFNAALSAQDETAGRIQALLTALKDSETPTQWSTNPLYVTAEWEEPWTAQVDKLRCQANKKDLIKEIYSTAISQGLISEEDVLETVTELNRHTGNSKDYWNKLLGATISDCAKSCRTVRKALQKVHTAQTAAQKRPAEPSTAKANAGPWASHVQATQSTIADLQDLVITQSAVAAVSADLTVESICSDVRTLQKLLVRTHVLSDLYRFMPLLWEFQSSRSRKKDFESKVEHAPRKLEL